MSEQTSATPVALVHGVGFGPSTFAQVQRELRRSGPVVMAVCHEPAVGSLGPELMALIERSLETGGVALVQALAGPATWARLSAGERAEVEAYVPIVADDARAYLAWEPLRTRAAEAAPIVCTVGQHSSPMRYSIARVVEERIGAQVVVVADCGHLVQLDAPSAFAAIISAAGAVAGPVGATSSTLRSTDDHG